MGSLNRVFVTPVAAQYCSSCPQACSPVGLGCNAGANGTCHDSPADPCAYSNGCPAGASPWPNNCCATVSSPIVLDLDGRGFHFTDPARGVWFHIYPNVRQLYRVAWPEGDSSNAWLVLDRNGNGRIDDFSEMFGDLTPQPDPPPGEKRNGFLALAVYDKPENGGNGDGFISEADTIYGRLRVWQDKNHNGISEPEELHTLASVGVKAISLKYRISDFTDRYGNYFRYRGKVRDDEDSEVNKTIWDVFPQMAPQP